MAAETLTGDRAARKFPPQGHGYQYMVPVFGNYPVAAQVEDGDIFELCRTPANFLMLFGHFITDDLDTGTEALNMDLGWAANGGSTETYTSSWGTVYTNAAGSASATGLVDAGTLTGDAVATDLVLAGTNWRPIIKPGGLFFSRPTIIQVEANTPANVFAAGDVSCVLWGVII